MIDKYLASARPFYMLCSSPIPPLLFSPILPLCSFLLEPPCSTSPSLSPTHSLSFVHLPPIFPTGQHLVVGQGARGGRSLRWLLLFRPSLGRLPAALIPVRRRRRRRRKSGGRDKRPISTSPFSAHTHLSVPLRQWCHPICSVSFSPSHTHLTFLLLVCFPASPPPPFFKPFSISSPTGIQT